MATELELVLMRARRRVRRRKRRRRRAEQRRRAEEARLERELRDLAAELGVELEDRVPPP